MTSLLEIAPATQPVKILDREATLRGFSLRKLASLLSQFPELSALIVNGGRKEPDIGKLLTECPDGAKALMKVGAPAPSDAWVADAFDDLPIKDQITLLSAVLTLTVPEAIAGPFVQAIHNMAAKDVAGSGQEVSSAATFSEPSPSPSSS